MKNIWDKANFVVTFLTLVIVPLCWYAVSQHIDLVKSTIESDAKDKYTPISRADQIDNHLNFVDQRENADREKSDLEIQQLQDKAGHQVSALTVSNDFDPKE